MSTGGSAIVQTPQGCFDWTRHGVGINPTPDRRSVYLEGGGHRSLPATPPPKPLSDFN